MDIEFEDALDGSHKYCQLKAGPNTINKDDVEKLVKLDVEFDKNQIDENGDLTIWDADEFYEIWKQLIVKANPNISIKRIKLKPFCSKCTGYGIYV